MRLNHKRWLLCAALLPALGCGAAPRIEREQVVLPYYPAMGEVTDRHGKVLNEVKPSSLEFSRIILSTSPSYSPGSEQDAACELKRMLPSSLYVRLLASRQAIADLSIQRSDPAVADRLYDIATYIGESWGDEWTEQRDWIRRLERLIDLSSSCVDLGR